MERRWIPGNHFALLENGEEFFPRVFACIANARREVIVETLILFEDKVGLQLQEALIAAARRGAQVDITIDDWGSPDLSAQFLGALRQAGVRIHSFNPGPRPFGWRPHLLRRMHRKLAVIEARVAFVGGINIIDDMHTPRHTPPRVDYAVKVEGPLLVSIHAAVKRLWAIVQITQLGHGWPDLEAGVATASGDWTFNDARYRSVVAVPEDGGAPVTLNGLRVFNTSKYVGSAAIDLSRPGAPWRISASGNWVGPYSPFDQPGRVFGAYGLVHLSAAWVFRRIEAELGVRNVFDRAYPELVAGEVAAPGQPRTAYVSVHAHASTFVRSSLR